MIAIAPKFGTRDPKIGGLAHGLLGCSYIEVYGIWYTVYGIWYTVYGIWYTRISVIETIVAKGVVYINIYGLQYTLYPYTWKRACSFFCPQILTTEGKTTLPVSIYIWKYCISQCQTYCSYVKRYKSIIQGNCCHLYSARK